MFKELMYKNRSCRKFLEERPVDPETLRELVELTRYSPSGSNRQGLKYILSHTPERNDEIGECLGWAGYLKDWPGPEKGERPSAFIVAVQDKSLGGCMPQDAGITGLTMLLGATEKGLAGCFLANINRPRLTDILKLEPHYKIEYVLALGYPAEKIVLEPMGEDGGVEYWRDSDCVHHVPKRSLEDILIT